jgi:hypothetical protein
VVVLDLHGKLLREAHHEGLQLPRGFSSHQTPPLALGPYGRTLLGGSPKRKKGAYLMRLQHLPEYGPQMLSLLSEEVVTAVAIAPSGDQAALGTSGGQVFLLPLVSNSSPQRPFGGKEVSRQETPLPDEMDLREVGGGRAGSVEDFCLLARWNRKQFPLKVCFLKLEGEKIWFYGARQAPRHGDSLAFRNVYFASLEGRSLTLFNYHLDSEGKPCAREEVSRWVFLTETVTISAPDGVVGPGLPEAPVKPGEVSVRKRMEAQIGAPTRHWMPGSGGRFAFCVVRCPREFWVVDTASPEKARRFPTQDRVHKLAWSPGGSQLGVLYRQGEVELYGLAPPGS